MPAFRGPDGRVIYVPDEQADRYRVGSEYQEIGNEAAGALANQIAPTHTGLTGTLGAAASSALSGATLGASDFALKGLLDTRDFEQVAQDRRDNPIVSGVGQVAGAIAPMLVSGGAATPAGALGRLAAGASEGAGLGTRLAVAAGEGAIQNAGIYLSDVALGDRNLTAEGINGALGTGLLFGAAGIPIAHGIEAGTIAARRMFARYAEGGAQAADAAAATWTEQAQKHLEGFDQAAELAQAKLAEAQAAREAANLQRLRAGTEMADARAFAPPAEFPDSPAGAPAAPGAEVEAAGAAAPSPSAAPGEPPDVAMARALRDRARSLGGEPITPGELPPGAPGFQRDYVIPGARAAPTPTNALDALAGESGVAGMGPATSVQKLGLRRVPVTADEAELGSRLAEYQDARRAFDELHAQVDPDLDAILRGVQPGDIQRPPVPIGEFGAPGARGIKTPDELARIAAGTGREEGAQAVSLASADATGAGGPRALRSQGTPPARSLGEVAAEQAPVSIEQPATAARKRPPAADAPQGPAGGRIEVVRVGKPTAQTFEARASDGSVTPVGRAEMQGWLEQNLPPGWRAGNLATHRNFSIEVGIPAKPSEIVDNAIYVVKPSELADRGVVGNKIRPADLESVRSALSEGKRLEPVMIDVAPNGQLHISDGNHRTLAAAQLGDRPMAVEFRRSSAPVELGDQMHDPKIDVSERIRAELPGGSSGLPERARIAGRYGKGAAPLPEGEVPDHAALDRYLNRTGKDYAELTLPARSIGERGYYEPPGGGVDAVRAENARKAIAEGQREPIKLGISPEGKIMVTDGRHRLAAAIEADAPIKVKWTTSTEPVESDVLRGGTRAPATDTLTGQLRGTAAKLGAGESLAEMGRAPAAATRAAQAERAAQSAERFRGKALAAREERAAAVATGETPSPLRGSQERPPVLGPEPHPWSPAGLKGRMSVLREHPELAKAERDAMRREAEAKTPAARAAATEARKRVSAEIDGLAEQAKMTHPFNIKRLEMAHDEALERAATAADPAERAAAAQEAQAIEKQITQVGARPGAVEDIAALAPAVTRIEKAAAALTEALGDVAPAAAKEHAAAFRAAEDEASRKTVARIGQAADDAAGGRAAAQSRDPLAPPARAPDDLLLGPSQKEQRIAAAQKAQREAGAAYAKARVAEAEAQIGAKQAAGAAADARAKLGSPPETPGATPRGHGAGGRVLHAAHAVGYAAELGSDLGIPGIPRPHDIPVIGPLLSAYLKYRALRAAAGRFMGRVPATAETRAAALAARTRDGIARAVDRSLGVIERNTNTVRAALTVGTLKAADALGKRLVDDGGPDAPPKASLSEQAAVRMREVAAVVTNPSLIHASVRVQGRALTDPDLIDALSNHLLTMFQHLNDVAPKGPPPNPFTGKQWTPSPADAIRFGQQVAIARDPQVAFEMLEAGTLTPAGADTLRKCYELLFRDGQQRVIQRAADLKHPVDYTQLIRIGRLFDLPLHPSQSPEHAAVLAEAHTPAAKPAPAAAAQSAPPTPSIAGPTTLSNLYQPSGERAQR